MGSSDLMLIAGLLLLGWSVYMFVSTVLATTGENKVLQWATDDVPEKSKSGFIELSRPCLLYTSPSPRD